MAKKTQDLIKIGNKVKEFREANGFSLINFAIVTGVSSATLSRIENGGNYTQNKLEAVCVIIGVQPDELLKTNILEIPKEKTAYRIKEQVRKIGVHQSDIQLISAERKIFHGPSYLVKRAIADGYLSKFRKVSEIQAYIEQEYGISLYSSSVTNALMRKDGIVYQLSGVANYYEYKFVRSQQPRK